MQRYPEGDFFNFEETLPQREHDKLMRVRDWAQNQVRPIAVEHWNNSEFPHQVIGQIADLEIMSLVRNQGFSHLGAGLITAEIHRADASVGTFMSGQDGLFTGSIELLGSEEQKQRLLPDIYALKKTGVFAITEPDRGSDVAGGLGTTARRDGDTWILNGTKRWIGNATFSDYVVVYAEDVDDHQIKGFIVDTTDPGYTATLMPKRIALRAVQNAEIELKDVRVPDNMKLANANSFRDVNKVLKDTRAVVGWQAVGLQRAAFDLAREHLVTREQFGKKLGEFQLLQDQLAHIVANLTMSMSTMARLAQLQDEGQARPEHTAMAKAHATRLTRESVSMARAMIGGNGIDTTYEIGKVFCDAEAIYTYEGTYEINQLITARSVTGLSAFV